MSGYGRQRPDEQAEAESASTFVIDAVVLGYPPVSNFRGGLLHNIISLLSESQQGFGLTSMFNRA